MTTRYRVLLGSGSYFVMVTRLCGGFALLVTI
jgi:hypothetical protein